MAEKRRTKVTLPSLTREYKTTTQLQAEAASLNWVAALVTVAVLLAAFVLNRLVEGTWQEFNIYIVVVTAFVAAVCFFGIKIANHWERAIILCWHR